MDGFQVERGRSSCDAAPTRAPVTLAELVGTATTDEFFAEAWERRPLLNRAAISATAELLTAEQFEALMAGAPAGSSSWLNVVAGRARPLAGSDGATVCLASLYRAYQAGSTLLMLDLPRRWMPIARLCRALEGELLALGVPLTQRIGANAYLTPARSQGFDIHYDDHCVVILQLAGRKQWRVYSPTVELPVGRCEQGLAEASVGAPLLEPELSPGDVLYIPRGFPHAARTTDHSSLHLTLSLHTLTWLALLGDLLRGQVELRRSVPLRGGDGAQARFDAVVLPACALTDLDDEVERRRSRLVASLSPLPQARLRAIDEVAAVGADTPVHRVAAVPCEHGVEDDQAVLRLPGATLRLPSPMAEVFAFVATTPSFAAADLPTTSAGFDAVELVRILIQEGLLCIQSAPPRQPRASS